MNLTTEHVRNYMRKWFQLLCTWLIIFLPMMVGAGPSWVLDQKVDPLTDEKIATAFSSYSVGVSRRAVGVRCTNKKFDISFGFGEFLNSRGKSVYVRYRVDKAPLVREQWSASVDGTAVFAKDDVGLARLLMNGATFIIEAEDFRGQPHRATFDLTGAADALEPVLRQCGVSPVGMEQQVEGLRREIARELERWRPRTISWNKKVLIALGKYNGPQDTSFTPEFLLAVQHFYDAYISKCKNGRLSDTTCDMLIDLWGVGGSWRARKEQMMPPISYIIYEHAPKGLKKEISDLQINE